MYGQMIASDCKKFGRDTSQCTAIWLSYIQKYPGRKMDSILHTVLVSASDSFILSITYVNEIPRLLTVQYFDFWLCSRTFNFSWGIFPNFWKSPFPVHSHTHQVIFSQKIIRIYSCSEEVSSRQEMCSIYTGNWSFILTFVKLWEAEITGLARSQTFPGAQGITRQRFSLVWNKKSPPYFLL